MKDAFPSPGVIIDGRQQGAYSGMSLRDYLAAQFAAAWIIALTRRVNEAGYHDADVIAEACHLGLLQADAMLTMREDK